MVDDPSEYTDELLADPATRQAAERELATRQATWLEKRAHQAEAAAAGDVEDPDPGPEPTLEGCAADLERARLFALIEQLVTWENTTNEPLLQQARELSCAAAGGAPARTTPITRGPPNCSIRTSCPPSTTPSPAAARCHSKHSGSGSRPTPAT